MRKAELDLINCRAEDINTFPDMKVDGLVWLPTLKYNPNIRRIPIIDLEIDHLNLNGCESLISLPAGLSVRGDLYLIGCKKIESLPEGLEVGGGLYLYGCESLTSLPERLKVGGWLDIRYCTKLESLPKDLEIKNDSMISYDSDTGFTKIEGWEDDPKIIPTRELKSKLRKHYH